MNTPNYSIRTGLMLVIFMAFTFCYSCHKDAKNKNCGCGSAHYTIVKDQGALLVRQDNTWVLASDQGQSPAFNGFICKETTQIINDFTKAFTADSVPVLFSGKKSPICIAAGQHQVLSANYDAFNIAIDSIKIK